MSRKPELRGRAARLARLFPAGRGNQAARTPFVLLVVLLLGGGLIGLLVLNSALSEGSFKLDDLQKQTKNLTDEEQALQRDIDAYSAPDALQRRARELGMVPGGDPVFLDPDGTVKGVPSPAALLGSSADGTRPLAPEALRVPSAAGPTGTPGAPVDTPPDTLTDTPETLTDTPSATASVPLTATTAPTPVTTPTPTPGR
ncbi:FtsB family cell division protein [Streptomyces arenae]|uniref:FtsB family cell division protein n=1 Tax=Streptomyces arenae TaxID=29301 RepID=UPI00265ADFEE|nr:septum formation initiator family protein [Streptomyces arenae]MCG7211111.1 septum formation initiator family protein [Streptomyces arenae]